MILTLKQKTPQALANGVFRFLLCNHAISIFADAHTNRGNAGCG